MPQSQKFNGFDFYWHCLPVTFIAFMILGIDSESPRHAWAPILIVASIFNMFPTILIQALFSKLRPLKYLNKITPETLDKNNEELSQESTDLAAEKVVSRYQTQASKKATAATKIYAAESLFIVPYQDMEGNLRRKWYGSKGNAKKGHTWFKKAQRLGKVQNLYPPMEQAVPEIDAMPKTKRELVEALNLSASFED
jgi:hypothetical protein